MIYRYENSFFAASKIFIDDWQHLPSDQRQSLHIWSDSTNQDKLRGDEVTNQNKTEDGSWTKDFVETNGTEFQMLNFAAKEDYRLRGIYVLLLLLLAGGYIV